ncbi:hypothetical protein C8Q78DRAFT_196529 [Trametes maxima]|nr:hypothetical protein C8Q78DRAFT_196529 [Trametes maxima]
MRSPSLVPTSTSTAGRPSFRPSFPRSAVPQLSCSSRATLLELLQVQRAARHLLVCYICTTPLGRSAPARSILTEASSSPTNSSALVVRARRGESEHRHVRTFPNRTTVHIVIGIPIGSVLHTCIIQRPYIDNLIDSSLVQLRLQHRERPRCFLPSCHTIKSIPSRPQQAARSGGVGWGGGDARPTRLTCRRSTPCPASRTRTRSRPRTRRTMRASRPLPSARSEREERQGRGEGGRRETHGARLVHAVLALALARGARAPGPAGAARAVG